MKLTLTASSMACALRCPRRYYYDNILGLKEANPSEALRIGTAVHNGGEARAKGADFAGQYAAAVTGTRLDEWMAARVFGILGAYDRMYGEIEDRDYAAMNPEVEFTDAINGSRTFEQRGKIYGEVAVRVLSEIDAEVTSPGHSHRINEIVPGQETHHHRQTSTPLRLLSKANG